MSYTPNAASITLSNPYLDINGTKYGPAYAFTDPSLQSWSWVNQGTATITSVNGAQVLTALSSAGAADLKMRVLTLPSAPFTITCAIVSTAQGVNFTRVGIGLRESSSNKVATLCATVGSSMAVDYWTNSTSYGSTPASIAFGRSTDLYFYRISKSGTTLTFSVSSDGNYFTTIHSATETVPFTTAPDQFCFVVNSNSSVALSGTLLSYSAA